MTRSAWFEGNEATIRVEVVPSQLFEVGRRRERALLGATRLVVIARRHGISPRTAEVGIIADALAGIAHGAATE